MLSRYATVLPIMILLFGVSVSAGAPATQPASDSSGQLTERQKNLLLQLSNAEANIQAINKALRITGYKVGVAYDRIDSNRKGNELMDRKGGGPVRWDDFYGRTARDFYAPQSWGTYHREGNGKTVDVKVAENYTQLKRPEQFDYIYKANDGQIARASEQIASLQNNQGALLARRQFHEAEQSRLWATLAWERVKDQEISFRPLYRFRLKPGGADAAVLRSIVRFIRAADVFSADGVESLKADQTYTFAKSNEQMQDSYRQLQQSLADVLYVPELKPENGKQGEALKGLCKRLAEQYEVIADNYQKAIDSDRAKEDASKLEFRAQLQTSLAYFAATVAELDQRVTETAAAWGVSGETGVANPDEASLVRLALPAPSPIASPPPGASEPPVAPSAPEASPINAGDWRVWLWSGQRWIEYPLGKMTVRCEGGVLRASNTTGSKWQRAILVYRGPVLSGNFDVTAEFRGQIESFDLQSSRGEDKRVTYLVKAGVDDQWHTVRFIRTKQDVVGSIDGNSMGVQYGHADRSLGGYFCFKLRPNDTVEIRNLRLQQIK